TGDEVPDELHEADDHELRITGTVLGDSRVSATARWQAGSPNMRDVKLVLDLSDRFHRTKIATEGNYRSELVGYQSPTDRDDEDAMREFLEKVREVEDVARMVAEFRLHGIHYEYDLGDMLTEVEGRRIVLNGKARSASEKRHLQITGIVWNFQDQTTTL